MRIADHMRPAADLQVFEPDSPRAEALFGLMDDQAKAAWQQSFDEQNEEYLANPPKDKEKAKWNYQRYIKNYLRCVASVDDSVGQMLDYLHENGLDENTIVIYSSDQGFYLGEHGWYDKRFMYEQSLRTPLVVRWPGVTEAGSVSDDIVSNLDFAETFLDAAGMVIPSDMQGRSLRPVLAGETPDDWREDFYYQFYEGPPAVHTVDEHYGVTDGRYKLIHFYEIDQWELFDLKKDPNEMRSVYGDAEYRDIEQCLKDRIKELREDLEVRSNRPIVRS